MELRPQPDKSYEGETSNRVSSSCGGIHLEPMSSKSMRSGGRGKLKICLISCVTKGYEWQTEVTNPFKMAYAGKWGYEYMFIEYGKSPTGRHPYWDRIWYLERHLPKYDAMWWLDADAAPVEMGKGIEDFLVGGYDFYISPETTGGRPYFNTGSFVVMNTDWGRGLLRHWGGGDVWNKFRRHGNPEQDALTELYNGDWEGARRKIKLLGRNDINSAGVGCGRVWKKGDLVKHLVCGKRRGSFEEDFWKGLDVETLRANGVVRGKK